jgi:hypothetical protein
LQDDLKKFVSEPQSPLQEVEIPEEGKTKAKERREVGEGDDTVIVEDTSDEDDCWGGYPKSSDDCPNTDESS